MKTFLVVYSEVWNNEVEYLRENGSAGFYDLNTFENSTQNQKYSRLNSTVIKAENKIEAYNKVKNSFEYSEAIVHIEEL